MKQSQREKGNNQSEIFTKLRRLLLSHAKLKKT